ncbi:hypothetical protein BURPS305_5304 [Burkholderia pseudomallei 305]|nr:hypothetical protein BURPS305_5304 [Burkholderia pseudomallei 305]
MREPRRDAQRDGHRKGCAESAAASFHVYPLLHVFESGDVAFFISASVHRSLYRCTF